MKFLAGLTQFFNLLISDGLWFRLVVNPPPGYEVSDDLMVAACAWFASNLFLCVRALSAKDSA